MSNSDRRHQIKVLVNDKEMGELITFLTSKKLTFVYSDAEARKGTLMQPANTSPIKATFIQPIEEPQRLKHGAIGNAIMDFFKSKKTWERLTVPDVRKYLASNNINAHNVYRTIDNLARNGLLVKHRDETYSRKTDSGNAVYVQQAGGNIPAQANEKEKKVYRTYEVPWKEWVLDLFFKAGDGATFTPDQVAEEAHKAGRNKNSGRLIMWPMEADGLIVPTRKDLPRMKTPFRLA